jgi:hypothetical protein
MTLCILAKCRWIMLPNAGRGHMLEDRFGIPQEVLARTDTMMFLATWSDPIAERPFPSLAMPESSGVTNLMRIDFRRRDVPAGTRGFQDAAVVEGGGNLTSCHQFQNQSDGSAGRYGRVASGRRRRHQGRYFRSGYSLSVPFRRTAQGRDWEQDIIIFTNMPMIRPAISRKR